MISRKSYVIVSHNYGDGAEACSSQMPIYNIPMIFAQIFILIDNSIASLILLLNCALLLSLFFRDCCFVSMVVTTFNGGCNKYYRVPYIKRFCAERIIILIGY